MSTDVSNDKTVNDKTVDDDGARVQRPRHTGTWPNFGCRAQRMHYGSAPPAGALGRVAAAEALADSEAVQQIGRLVKDGDCDGHSVEALLIGTAVRLAAKARACAGGAVCPLRAPSCQQRQSHARCPMHTLIERLDDLEDLYGAEFAAVVLAVVSRLAPCELGTTIFDGTRAHHEGRLEAAIMKRRILGGRLTPDATGDVTEDVT